MTESLEKRPLLCYQDNTLKIRTPPNSDKPFTIRLKTVTAASFDSSSIVITKQVVVHLLGPDVEHFKQGFMTQRCWLRPSPSSSIFWGLPFSRNVRQAIQGAGTKNLLKLFQSFLFFRSGVFSAVEEGADGIIKWYLYGMLPKR